MLTEECKNRLYNFKFGQAAGALTDEVTMEERRLVEALSDSFGSPGWFDGGMATVIWAALKSVGVDVDD